MTAEEILQLIANVIILATGAVLLTFIVLYAWFFNWRQTAGGRSVMYFVSSLELLIFLAAFLNWVHFLSDETEQLLRLEVYITIFAAGMRMLYVLISRWRVTGQLSFDVEARNREKQNAPTV